jgi:heme-degrading monooxygenase HmoA
MFVVMSVHHPHPEYETALIDSMHRFGAAVRGKPGCREIHTLKDETAGVLVGLAIFESRAAWERLAPLARAAVADDDFDLWEELEPEGFVLAEV